MLSNDVSEIEIKIIFLTMISFQELRLKIDSPLLGFEPGTSPVASRHANR